MAYGCENSLNHCRGSIERLSEMLKPLAADVAQTGATREQKLIAEIAQAVAYLHDAVRYLKDGVP